MNYHNKRQRQPPPSSSSLASLASALASLVWLHLCFSFMMPLVSSSTAMANCGSTANMTYVSVEQFLDQTLCASIYDRRIRPFYREKKPTQVNMNIHINTISAINEVYMEYIVDSYFRQEWVDPRLAYNHTQFSDEEYIVLHYDQLSKIWVPDSFFRNAKDATTHEITVPNRLIRIYPEGRILYSQRLTLKLECPMKLQKFPLDNQTCSINIGSYGYTTKDVVFGWRKPAVAVSDRVEMPDFKLSFYEAYSCTRATGTGAFACLKIDLHLQRSLGYYMIEVFLPSVLIVVLSFVAFWIDYRAVPARILIGLLPVLTVTTQSGGLRAQLPRVSYTKAVDVWMSTCLVFVFFGLVEYAVVNVIARSRPVVPAPAPVPAPAAVPEPAPQEPVTSTKQWLAAALQSGSQVMEKMVGTRLAHTGVTNFAGTTRLGYVGSQETLISTMPVRLTKSTEPTPKPAPPPPPARPRFQTAELLDIVARVFFPLSFIIFNIAFWLIYINMHVPN